jgi:ubiquinone/menaquinone biosynthesis C-methylase UbiE
MSDKTQETKNYFDNNTEFWSSLFNDSIYGTTTQRVRLVANKIRGLVEYHNSSIPKQDFTHLDFGCGTGELASISASMGIQVIAIDVAPAMIDATLSAIDEKFAKRTKVLQGDISILGEIEDSSIDVFSALGLIEYLTIEELDVFLKDVARILRPSGRAYIGSRNRLFNIYSDNEFTNIERSIGEYDKLSAEYDAVCHWISEDSLLRSLNDKTKIGPFLKWKYPDVLPNTSPVTVSQRVQYSVCDLSMRLINCGLNLTDINAVRFHPAKPAILEPNTNIDLIDAINMAIDEHGNTKWAVPYSSTYLLEVAKE